MSVLLRNPTLNHRLEVIVQPQYFEEALSCLVESIIYVRSKGKMVRDPKLVYREDTMKTAMKYCTSFNLQYSCNESSELQSRILDQIQRIRWLCCVEGQNANCSLSMKFYKNFISPTKFSSALQIFEIWQIRIRIVTCAEAGHSQNQVQEMVNTLRDCISYIHECKFCISPLSNIDTFEDLVNILDLVSFTDVSLYHFFFDLNFQNPDEDQSVSQ
ncbi:autophagy-related protein 101-like [Octopus sinensis]|uniref:Autophagy-related protein 101-like n=1 Tax=Octopus sinensis TaxID=2607531 RepID=A0A6P7TVW3_9MOLL|nr:autophagy-related protein 101-like [Octopus sinensis]